MQSVNLDSCSPRNLVEDADHRFPSPLFLIRAPSAPLFFSMLFQVPRFCNPLFIGSFSPREDWAGFSFFLQKSKPAITVFSYSIPEKGPECSRKFIRCDEKPLGLFRTKNGWVRRIKGFESFAFRVEKKNRQTSPGASLGLRGPFFSPCPFVRLASPPEYFPAASCSSHRTGKF